MLKTAIESLLRSRLTAYDPSIDSSAGSPADIEIVQPVISRLGTFPLDTSTREFIKARIRENYPDIYTEAELETLFINPLETILEPVILEEGSIQNNQSIVNASTMSEEELDDLCANAFVNRDVGGYATGFVRSYYNSPTSLSITTDNQIVSKSGLNFFPSANFELSSAQMLLNREGFLFFVDIAVIAENPGDAYNIDIDQILSIADLKNPVKITNLTKFTGGSNRDANTELVTKYETSRTEQSLVTKRGAIARTTSLFSDIKTMQVIGAGEKGMERDILMGSSDGLVYMSFVGGIFGSWVFINNNFRYKDPLQSVEVGDKIKFSTTTFGDLRVAKVEKVLFHNGTKYFLQLDTNFPTIYGQGIDGVLIKPGVITVSKVPEGSFTGTVPSEKVHLYGYSDVYVAGNTVQETFVNVVNTFDEKPVVASEGGKVVLNDNKFETVPFIDFVAAGVKIGDSLTIETGSSVGTYEILYVDPLLIRVNTLFAASESNLRAKIHRTVNVNYTAPKTVKLPFFGTISDLSTVNGSTLFQTTTNTLTYGAAIGDILEVLSGPNIGVYTITGFDTFLGGYGPLVDRAAVATDSSIKYTIYTLKDGLTPPFLRIRDVEVLDSSNQSTGYKVPYGDFVDIRSKCDFETTNPEERVLDKRLFFLPAAPFPIPNDPAVPGPGVDARYTQRLESYDGTLRKITCLGTNPIQTVEINIPPFLLNGFGRNAVLALVSKKDLDFLTDPFNNPQTSPLAKAAPGYILTIRGNMNEESFMIRDVRRLSLWGKTTNGHYEIALIQIDGEFKYDPVSNLLALIAYGNILGSGVPVLSLADYMKIFEYSTAWTDPSSFLESVLIPRTQTTLSFLGFTISLAETKEFVYGTCMTSYSVGEAPRGELRCYAKEPITTKFFTTPIITINNAVPTSTEFLELLDYSSTVPRKKVKIVPELKSGQIFPLAYDEQPVEKWSREGSQNYPASEFFSLIGETFLSKGVIAGDTLEYLPAINDYSSRYQQVSSYLAVTLAGSNEIRFLWPAIRNNPTNFLVGQVVCIDSGPDEGFYTITDIVSDAVGDYRVKVNKVLSHNTLPYPTNLFFNTGTCVTGSTVINDINITGVVNAGDWITIYAATSTAILTAGEDTDYIGSYLVNAVGLGSATLARTSPFPANANILWVHHPAPSSPPSPTTNGGTEITTQYVRARHYSNTVATRIVDIDWTVTPNPLDILSTEQLKLDTSLTTNGSLVNFSYRSPFRVTRRGVKIISATEMSNYRENGLYYVDVPVLSLGTAQEFLFKKNTPFEITGGFLMEGYRITPDNFSLSYSTKETGYISFPTSIVPVGSQYNSTNKILLSGQNLKINYDLIDLIAAIQEFYDSPLDRVVCANILARSMLPSYPYIEASYVGGRDTDVVASAILTYITSIQASDNQISVDKLIDTIKRNLAAKVYTPITLVSLTHGNDRKIRALRSQDSVGYLDVPIYRGDPRTIIFYAGKDVSKETVIPDIEYVKLVRS